MARKKLEDVDRCRNLTKNTNFIWYLKQLAERRQGLSDEIGIGISLSREEILAKQIEIKILDDFITSPFALIELDELDKESLKEESEG